MKKFLILAVASVLSFAVAHAQKPERLFLKDTLTNADTSTVAFNSVGSHVKSIQFAMTKISGTVAGSFYLQGTIDGVNWDSLSDTTTVANQALNKRTWLINSTNYNSYRVYVISSGTMKVATSVALLRRQDE